MARKIEVVVFNGIRFRRYPDSLNWAERSYYTPDGRYRKQGVGRLHQEIWKAARGPIPAGHDIHHVDGNPLNNDIGNLEAIHPHAHRDLHTPGWISSSAARSFSEAGQERARAWHRSAEGRAWHREHARQAWAKRESIERVCEQCGRTYDSLTRRPEDRFCSGKCKTKARRLSGVDDIEVTCPIDGTLFRTNAYRGSETCSRSCGARLRAVRRRT